MRTRAMDWVAWGVARLGWAGISGLALMLAAGSIEWGLTRPLRMETADLAVQAERLEARKATKEPQPPPPAERLADARHAPEAVAALFAAAGKAGLRLDKGDYKLIGTEGGGLLHYQISLPLSGGYPALRGFLAAALNGNPDLALDGLSLGRQAVEEAELTANLRFTLFLSGSGGR